MKLKAKKFQKKLLCFLSSFIQLLNFFDFANCQIFAKLEGIWPTYVLIKMRCYCTVG